MGEELVVRRVRELMDVGEGVDGPAPEMLRAFLHEDLAYWHANYARATSGYGAPSGARYEHRRLSLCDGRGRVVCSAGFGPRVHAAAVRLGFACRAVVEAPVRWERALEPDWDALTRKFEARPRQEEAIAALAAAIASGWGGMVVAPPGFGKGMIIAALTLLYPRAKIAVVTASRDVARTVRGAIGRFAPTGLVGAGSNTEKRCTVYVARSLCGVAGNVCDLLIGDEVHELAAPTYADAVSCAGAGAVKVGLTATPAGRSDGSDRVIEGLFGPVVFHLSYKESVALELVAQIRVIWHDVKTRPNPVEEGDSDIKRYRKGIWEHRERNEAVARAARLHGDDEQVLILVDKVAHAFALAALLSDFAVCCGSVGRGMQERWSRTGLVTAERVHTSSEAREALRTAFERGEVKRVIATGVWSRGVDFRGLGVLVTASGLSSTIASTQVPGRASRYAPELGKYRGVVHDFRDQFDPRFREAARRRGVVYASHGFEQSDYNSQE